MQNSRIRMLITESADPKTITDSIRNTEVVEMSYGGNSAQGTKVIEPISYGLNQSNNPVIRAWVRSGDSESYDSGNEKPNDPLTKIPGYRMFRVDKINSYRPTGEKYRTDKTFLRKNRPQHNKLMNREDSDMPKVFISVTAGKTISGEYIFNQVKEKIKKKFRPFGKYLTKLDKFTYDELLKRIAGNDVRGFEEFTSQSYKINIISRILTALAIPKKRNRKK